MHDQKLSASAANFRAICSAVADHDVTCRYGGKAQEAHLNPTDIKNCGWEDGDDIGGVTVVSNDKRPVGTLRIYCDAELRNEEARCNAQTLLTPVTVGTDVRTGNIHGTDNGDYRDVP